MSFKKCECCGKRIQIMGGRKFCNNCGLFTRKLRRDNTQYKRRIMELELKAFGATDTRKERWDK